MTSRQIRNTLVGAVSIISQQVHTEQRHPNLNLELMKQTKQKQDELTIAVEIAVKIDIQRAGKPNEPLVHQTFQPSGKQLRWRVQLMFV